MISQICGIKACCFQSETESETFYSVLFQTQETSAKTIMVAIAAAAQATWKRVYRYMYIKIIPMYSKINITFLALRYAKIYIIEKKNL